jgi:biotin-(acetyl-CoA carboxylase) ligase
MDAALRDLRSPGGRAKVIRAWRSRLLLLGEPVTYVLAGRPRHGILRDVSLEEGLLVEDPEEGVVRRRPEHVQDLRPAGA